MSRDGQVARWTDDLITLIPMNNQQQLLLQLHHHLQHPVIENNNKGCDYDGEDFCGENVNLY